MRRAVVAPTPFRNDDYWHMTRNSGLADYRLRLARAEAPALQPLGRVA
jgi:4-hydroxyacetophenone monooxygenase